MPFCSIYGEFEPSDSDKQRIRWMQSYSYYPEGASLGLILMQELYQENFILGGTWLLTIKPLDNSAQSDVAAYESEHVSIGRIKDKVFSAQTEKGKVLVMLFLDDEKPDAELVEFHDRVDDHVI